MALTIRFINRIGTDEKTVRGRECGATALVACLEGPTVFHLLRPQAELKGLWPPYTIYSPLIAIHDQVQEKDH